MDRNSEKEEGREYIYNEMEKKSMKIIPTSKINKNPSFQQTRTCLPALLTRSRSRTQTLKRRKKDVIEQKHQLKLLQKQDEQEPIIPANKNLPSSTPQSLQAL